MQNLEKYPGLPEGTRGRYNRRRLVILMVIIFVVVLSFFAGRVTSSSKTYIQPGNPSTLQHPGSDRAGIPPSPPDSLSP
ncbi:MAG TPA: hypothetical protein VG605_14945 [Puia sp.]|nr:hypothetical protein [Puia sp.]